MNIDMRDPEQHEGGAAPGPTVSVIIAAYNCERFLALAIESSLAQSETRLEVVVVDDASSDTTAEVARQYEPTGRVRVLVNERNLGPSGSRNRAIEAARGEWLVQLDGDDWMVEDRVERMLGAAARHGADVVTDDLLVVDDDTMRAVSTRYADKGVPWTTETLYGAPELLRYDLGSVKPMIRRTLLMQHGLRFPTHLRYGEDFVFLLSAMRAGARFVALPQAGYRLRRGNTGSLTSQKAKLYEQTIRFTDELLSDPITLEDPALVTALRGRRRYLGQLAALDAATALMRAGHWHRVLWRLGSQPSLMLPLLRRLPAMLSKRWRRASVQRALKAELPVPTLRGAAAFIPERAQPVRAEE